MPGTIEKSRLENLRKESKLLNPVIRIGKNGLTDNMHNEIDRMLKTKQLIKVKVLSNSPDRDVESMIQRILQRSECILIDKIGLTFTLYRWKAL